MFKVLWLLRRKEGVSHEQFREHFENEHAPLAMKHIGQVCHARAVEVLRQRHGEGESHP